MEGQQKPTLRNGHIDMDVPEGIDLRAEIARMKKEKNAVILAHYYTRKSPTTPATASA